MFIPWADTVVAATARHKQMPATIVLMVPLKEINSTVAVNLVKVHYPLHLQITMYFEERLMATGGVNFKINARIKLAYQKGSPKYALNNGQD